MIEILDKQGKSIATVHDQEAFSQLIDTFEKNLHLYFQALPPQHLRSASIYGIDSNLRDYLMSIIEELRGLRKQLGDSRENLYSVDELLGD